VDYPGTIRIKHDPSPRFGSNPTEIRNRVVYRRFCKKRRDKQKVMAYGCIDQDHPIRGDGGYAMTGNQCKGGRINLQEIFGANKDGLKELLRDVLQEVLEQEMTGPGG
jgi:hypothetical protein